MKKFSFLLIGIAISLGGCTDEQARNPESSGSSSTGNEDFSIQVVEAGDINANYNLRDRFRCPSNDAVLVDGKNAPIEFIFELRRDVDLVFRAESNYRGVGNDPYIEQDLFIDGERCGGNPRTYFGNGQSESLVGTCVKPYEANSKLKFRLEVPNERAQARYNRVSVSCAFSR